MGQRDSPGPLGTGRGHPPEGRPAALQGSGLAPSIGKGRVGHPRTPKRADRGPGTVTRRAPAPRLALGSPAVRKASCYQHRKKEPLRPGLQPASHTHCRPRPPRPHPRGRATPRTRPQSPLRPPSGPARGLLPSLGPLLAGAGLTPLLGAHLAPFTPPPQTDRVWTCNCFIPPQRGSFQKVGSGLPETAGPPRWLCAHERMSEGANAGSPALPGSPGRPTRGAPASGGLLRPGHTASVATVPGGRPSLSPALCLWPAGSRVGRPQQGVGRTEAALFLHSTPPFTTRPPSLSSEEENVGRTQSRAGPAGVCVDAGPSTGGLEVAFEDPSCLPSATPA